MLIPLNPSQWDFSKAAHLLNRAGFGGSPEQIETLREAGFPNAVEQLLDGPDDLLAFPKPAWAVPQNMAEMRSAMMMLPPDEMKMKRKEMQKDYRGQLLDLVTWWLTRMRDTPNPLREKLTLFWHGHFATSFAKVKQPYLMWLQNETLRQNALGNFRQMAKAMSRDPAMLVWLDTRESKKEHPNENFSRELMELFTLGIGNYTEDDIQQSARAFTGYRIDPVDESFRYAPFQHDDGEKKFFGQTGPFNGDDIIDLIVKNPACPRFITRKIWEFFVDDDPNPGVLEAIAWNFQRNDFAIRPLMREIFQSAAFYSPDVIRAQIKSPVQWLVQTSKELEINIPPGLLAMNALRQMGQVPFLPPNVKGWDGGKSWITTSTLLFRYNLLNFGVCNGPLTVQKFHPNNNAPAGQQERQVDFDSHIDLAKIAPPEIRADSGKLVGALTQRLFQDSLSPNETEAFVKFVEAKKPDTSDQTVRELLHLMMSTPQFQLT